MRAFALFGLALLTGALAQAPPADIDLGETSASAAGGRPAVR